MAYKRMTPKPPLLIQMAPAADMLGRTTKAVGKILRDHGAQPRKYGKRWCVPVAEFRRVLLEIQAEEAAAANEVAQPEAGMASKDAAQPPDAVAPNEAEPQPTDIVVAKSKSAPRRRLKRRPWLEAWERTLALEAEEALGVGRSRSERS